MTIITGLLALFFRRSFFQKSLVDIAKIYDVMGEVVNDTTADRFLIYQLTNGGGRPAVGSKLYASVLYEYRNTSIKSLKEDFQEIEVDEAFINILVRIEHKSNILIKREEIDFGLLKSLYDRDKVTISYLFKIRETRHKYYYGSIQTTNQDGILDIATIELAVSRIRSIFKSAK